MASVLLLAHSVSAQTQNGRLPEQQRCAMKSMLVGGCTGSRMAEMYDAMPYLLVYGR
jgi:hypothetical protein